MAKKGNKGKKETTPEPVPAEPMPNKIHGTVREGSTLYMPDNQKHANDLVEILTPRACRRLLDANVVSGDGFEDKADDAPHDAVEGSDGAEKEPWVPAVDGDEAGDK